MTHSIPYLMFPLLHLNSASFSSCCPHAGGTQTCPLGVVTLLSVASSLHLPSRNERWAVKFHSFQGFSVTGKDFHVMSHPTLFHIIYYLILLFLSIHRRPDLIQALISSSLLFQILSYTTLPRYLGYLALGKSKSRILRVSLTGSYWSVIFLLWSLASFLSYHMKKPCLFSISGTFLFNQYSWTDRKL